MTNVIDTIKEITLILIYSVLRLKSDQGWKKKTQKPKNF